MTDSKTDERGALFVTADSEDPRFNQPYVDVREWRDEPPDAPVFPGTITTRHRHLSGRHGPRCSDLGCPHVTATHAFSKPGTYFPALRVASQREGDPNTPFARALNLSRVRVVVKD